MDDNRQIREANRKAMPKFILMLAVSTVVGACLGILSAICGLDALADGIKRAGEFFGSHVAPWLILAISIILPIVCIPVYRGAGKLIAAWDGEDEAVSDEIERRLSTAIWVSSVALIVSFFLIAASYSVGSSGLDERSGRISVLVAIAAFFAVMVEAVIIQQKCVDATKKLYPEKTASIFDMKFQKKWVDSCDEAEKMMMAKCAFRAYSATNIICCVLAVLLAVGALIFGIGFLPSLVVCVIWVGNLSVYYREAMKYSKTGCKLS